MPTSPFRPSPQLVVDGLTLLALVQGADIFARHCWAVANLTSRYPQDRLSVRIAMVECFPRQTRHIAELCEESIRRLGHLLLRYRMIHFEPQTPAIQAGELGDPTERVNKWAAAQIAKERREGTFQSWDSLFTQGLQAIRLKASYVDVTPSGDVQNDPSTIDDSSNRCRFHMVPPQFLPTDGLSKSKSARGAISARQVQHDVSCLSARHLPY